MVGLDGDGVQADGLVDRELLDEGAERRPDVRAVQIGPAVVVEVRGRVGGERGAGGVVVEQVVDEDAKGCARGDLAVVGNAERERGKSSAMSKGPCW